MKNFVITVARGFGSGGRQIAAKLADELHIHSYNNRILTLASQYSGYDEHYFKEEKHISEIWNMRLQRRSAP